MHELTEKIIKEDGHTINDTTRISYAPYEKIIREWLEEKAKLLRIRDNPMSPNWTAYGIGFVDGHNKEISKILGLTEKTLKDKLEEWESLNVNYGKGDTPNWDTVAQIAKEHYEQAYEGPRP